MTEMQLDVDLVHPPERVWRALTDRRLLAEWFMPTDLQPHEGDQFQLVPSGLPGFAGPVTAELTELAAPRRLVMNWHADQLHSKVVWELEPMHGGCRLRLLQSGLGGGGVRGGLRRRELRHTYDRLFAQQLPAVLDRLASGQVDLVGSPAVALDQDQSVDRRDRVTNALGAGAHGDYLGLWRERLGSSALHDGEAITGEVVGPSDPGPRPGATRAGRIATPRRHSRRSRRDGTKSPVSGPARRARDLPARPPWPQRAWRQAMAGGVRSVTDTLAERRVKLLAAAGTVFVLGMTLAAVIAQIAVPGAELDRRGAVAAPVEAVQRDVSGGSVLTVPAAPAAPVAPAEERYTVQGAPTSAPPSPSTAPEPPAPKPEPAAGTRVGPEDLGIGAVPPPAVDADAALTATIRTEYSLSLSYRYGVTVRNPSDKPVTGWTVTVTLPALAVIVDVRGAYHTQIGDTVVFTPLLTAQTVRADGRTPFTFEVLYSTLLAPAEPLECAIDGRPCGRA